MPENLEALLLKAEVANPERAESLWAEYRTGGPGAEGAFNTLLAWYGMLIYRHIWGFLRSDAAEDVFQEVLVKWHQHRHKLATFEHAHKWLRTVAIRKCVDAHRREARRKKHESKRAVNQDDETPGEGRTDVQEVLKVALAKLPTKQREAIALVFFEEMDQQVAANVLGVHRNTLAKRLEEALTRLRQLVPLPAVMATGGTLGIQSLLEATPPICTRGWLLDLSRKATAKTAASGRSAKFWAVGLVIGLTMTSGAVVAGWQLFGDSPLDPALKGMEPTPPRSLRQETAAAKTETVPERNLRVYKAEVLPKQLEALKGMVIGDGTVEFERVEAYEIQLHCFFKLRHKTEFRPGWITRLELDHTTQHIDTGKRTTTVWMDLFGGEGKWRERKNINPKRAIIIGQNPFTGKEISLKSSVLEAAVAEFDAIPHDALSDEELRGNERRLTAAAQPYLGVWYAMGDPHRRCEVRLERPLSLKIFPDSGPGEHISIYGLRTNAAGQLLGLTFRLDATTLSADGRRLELKSLKEWWSREPVGKVVK